MIIRFLQVFKRSSSSYEVNGPTPTKSDGRASSRLHSTYSMGEHFIITINFHHLATCKEGINEKNEKKKSEVIDV